MAFIDWRYVGLELELKCHHGSDANAEDANSNTPNTLASATKESFCEIRIVYRLPLRWMDFFALTRLGLGFARTHLPRLSLTKPRLHFTVFFVTFFAVAASGDDALPGPENVALEGRP